jgi:hypothetical protein
MSIRSHVPWTRSHHINFTDANNWTLVRQELLNTPGSIAIADRLARPGRVLMIWSNHDAKDRNLTRGPHRC